MTIKSVLKNSPFFPILGVCRYFFYRFVMRAEFSPVKLNQTIKMNQVDSEICFFGYYNISPSNKTGDVLYLKTKKEITGGSKTEPASIMLKSHTGETKKLTQTRAWNWQQGCMLQWFPGKDEQILYNDYEEITDRYISKVLNTSGKLVKTYPLPVNNVSRCGQFALSLNYDRLAKMQPAYGYYNKKNNVLPPDDKDGIWYLDLTNGDTKLIVTLEQLKLLSYSSTMDGARHKVNHIDINPAGSRFMFLHRWIGPQGRFTRLITADPDGTDIYMLNGDKMTSHCCWLNDKNILSFCESNGLRGYHHFEDKTSNVKVFSNKMPKVDGHPSISPNGKWIITDTYPDKARMACLYLYHIERDRIENMGRFLQPLKYKGEIRIDLHPKWSADGRSIYFESGHNGKRQLYSIFSNVY